MMIVLHRQLAGAALVFATATFVAATTRALVLQPLPAPVAPYADVLPASRSVSARSESVIHSASSDAFLLAEQPVEQATIQASATLVPDPVRLTGTIALPSGGVAVVESSQGSRIMRVGESWSGLRLREVVNGQAMFVDASTGEPVTLRIRKAGS